MPPNHDRLQLDQLEHQQQIQRQLLNLDLLEQVPSVVSHVEKPGIDKQHVPIKIVVVS